MKWPNTYKWKYLKNKATTFDILKIFLTSYTEIQYLENKKTNIP